MRGIVVRDVIQSSRSVRSEGAYEGPVSGGGLHHLKLARIGEVDVAQMGSLGFKYQCGTRSFADARKILQLDHRSYFSRSVICSRLGLITL